MSRAERQRQSALRRAAERARLEAEERARLERLRAAGAVVVAPRPLDEALADSTTHPAP